MGLYPVLRNVGPGAYPDVFELADMVEKSLQPCRPNGMSGKAHMQSDRHHFGPRRTFVIEQIEAVAKVVKKGLAVANETACKLGVVIGERIGNDQMRAEAPWDR